MGTCLPLQVVAVLGNVSAVGSPSTDLWLHFARFRVCRVWGFRVWGVGV